MTVLAQADWGASIAMLHLGKGYIKIKITWCRSSPGACSQVSKRGRAAVAPAPPG